MAPQSCEKPSFKGKYYYNAVKSEKQKMMFNKIWPLMKKYESFSLILGLLFKILFKIEE